MWFNGVYYSVESYDFYNEILFIGGVLAFIIGFVKASKQIKKIDAELKPQLIEQWDKKIENAREELSQAYALREQYKQEFDAHLEKMTPIFFEHLPKEFTNNFCWAESRLKSAIEALKYGKANNLKEAFLYIEEQVFRKQMLSAQSALENELAQAQSQVAYASAMAAQAQQAAQQAQEDARNAEYRARSAEIDAQYASNRAVLAETNAVISRYYK